ncbi:MAG: prepilin-type N-terminal cleavage/methylation domain-containing protein [Patescibacteria group bacterium]|nr:prepilin-type N-terminal cleavage/methylation domain-containing protein [Patescibacteria group bacterium]
MGSKNKNLPTTNYKLPTQQGFSLVEVILASAVFVLFVTALVGAYLYGQESTALAGNRARATILAEEGLEAVRNIRDAGFSNLTDGTYGLAVVGNQWALFGTSDTTGIFTRQITISAVDSERKSVTANVAWQQNAQRPGAVALTTYLTNWKKATPVNSCDIYCQLLGTYTTGTCRENSQQCTKYDEIYEAGGDPICVTSFPGDASHDTCCCKP